MKRLIVFLALSLGILGYILPSTHILQTAVARDFVRFGNVDVIPYNGCPIPKYKSFGSNDYYEDFGSWDITLGKEVTYGEYLIEDVYGTYLKGRIKLDKSGLSGYSGMLVYDAGRVEKPDIPAYKDYPRYYYSPIYIFWLNPYSN